MSKEKWVVAQNVIATIACAVLIWQAMREGFPITSALLSLSIALINGLTVGQIYRGVKFAKAEESRRESQQGSD